MNTYFVSDLCQEKHIDYDPQTHTPGRNGYNAARRQYDAQRNVSNRQQVSSAPRLHRTHGNNVSGKRRERSFQLHRILLFLAFTLLIAFLCGISFGSILSKAETIDARLLKRSNIIRALPCSRVILSGVLRQTTCPKNMIPYRTTSMRYALSIP